MPRVPIQARYCMPKRLALSRSCIREHGGCCAILGSAIAAAQDHRGTSPLVEPSVGVCVPAAAEGRGLCCAPAQLRVSKAPSRRFHCLCAWEHCDSYSYRQHRAAVRDLLVSVLLVSAMQLLLQLKEH